MGGLVGLTVLMVILNIINLATYNSYANHVCNDENWDSNECDNYKTAVVAGGIIGIIVGVLCCVCF